MDLNNQIKVDNTLTIFQWIEEYHDRKTAAEWLWACTPYPAGLPNDKMLEDGLNLASREITLNFLHEKVWTQINQAMKEYREKNPKQAVD